MNKIRFGRILEQLENQGQDTSQITPPPNLGEKYVQCPYCYRKFAPIPAEKHIPICRNIINKPKPPPGLSNSNLYLPGIRELANRKEMRVGLPSILPRNSHRSAVKVYSRRDNSDNSVNHPIISKRNKLIMDSSKRSTIRQGFFSSVAENSESAAKLCKQIAKKRSLTYSKSSNVECGKQGVLLPEAGYFCMMCKLKRVPNRFN